MGEVSPFYCSILTDFHPEFQKRTKHFKTQNFQKIKFKNTQENNSTIFIIKNMQIKNTFSF
jgi:hypothetical protein